MKRVLAGKTEGITLILLVITIIIMLILAGVVISITLNGGLIERTTDTTEEARGTSVKEESEIWKNEANYVKEFGGIATPAEEKIEDLYKRGLLREDERNQLIEDGKYNGDKVTIGGVEIDFIVESSTGNSTDTAIPIATEEDLQKIANGKSETLSNGKTYTMGKRSTYRIVNDITITKPFTPITEFGGIINGNGKKIINFTSEVKYRFSYENSYSRSYYGFIGFIGYNSGTIKGLGFENVNINAEYTWFYKTGSDGKTEYYELYEAGGIVTANAGLIEECYVTGTIIGGYIGGIIGYNETGGKINRCYNEATIEATDRASGICVYNEGIISKCYNKGNIASEWNGAAGIVLRDENGVVAECYNEGTISGYTGGGIACWSDGTTIKDCYNIGSIYGMTTSAGIVVEPWRVKIETCFNAGLMYWGGEEADRMWSFCNRSLWYFTKNYRDFWKIMLLV